MALVHVRSKPVALAVVFALVGVIAACGGGGATPSSSPIALGELFPLTGKGATPGQFMIKGAETGVNDVNNHGGVMGRKLVEYSADDASDAADAVPLFRQMLTHDPSFIAGPDGIVFSAVQPLIDSAQVPSFIIDGSPALDNLNDPWVYRMTDSDSVLGTAMAYYAIQKGLTKCSMLFETGEASQSIVPQISAPFTAHGGTVVANVSLVPDQISYSSEVVKAFAGNPQCVFIQTDAQTAGTLFAAARSLGHLNVPFIGTNNYDDVLVAKAIGLPDASKWVTGMAGSSPTSAAYSYFLSAYKAAQHGGVPGNFSSAEYDAVIIAALAMTAAGSSDPKVWAAKITQVVSNPSGLTVTNYADGVKLLKQGKKINYVGASGSLTFNSHHSVFTGFDVVQFNTSGQAQTIFSCPANALSAF
jgi:ABC-type branched-subunit amino acid transport system substrate-binding protein